VGFIGRKGDRLALGVDLRQQSAGALVDREHGGGHRDVDVLAFPCLVPVLEGGQHRDHALQPGIDVGVARGVVHRRAQGGAVVGVDNRGMARLALHRRREGGPAAPGRGLAVTADRHINDTGIVGAHLRVRETEARERARAEILHDDVGVAAEFRDDLPRFFPVEVEAEVAFAGVLLNEIEAHVADVRQALATDVARRGLDLDDVGAEVA
jgi:hypothetical protein